MDTPNLDRLVNEGVVFTHSFVSSPSCAPSRASLFTGYFPHTTGIFENMDCWTHSWVEQLSDSGYHCVNIGKMHTMPWETPLGFHERFVVENKDRYRGDRWYIDEWDKALRARGLAKPSRASYAEWPDWEERLGAYEWPLPADMHPDNFVGDLATWWLDYQPKTVPLFMSIGFPGPHPPYDPVESYVAPYLAKDLPILDFSPEELEAQPATYRSTREKMLSYNPDAVRHIEYPSYEQRQRQRAYYFANITMIDEKIGQIIDALDDNNYLENSVIIFVSDHGDCLGDHGHSQKFTFYEPVVRTPCIFWAPGLFGGARQLDDLVQTMDVGPTILELAGLDPHPSMEAQSLLPFLQDSPEACGREYVFSEHGRDFYITDTDFVTMIRDRSWKLVHFLGHDDGILTNLDSDPDETQNLWDDRDYQMIKRRLLDALRDWLIKSNYQTRTRTIPWR
jgi:arylsulfatase A-like enzyme